MRKVEFPSYQSFDLNGLKGRLMSSSYCPAVGTEGHDELMIDIEKLYTKYSTESGVQFDNSTPVYIAVALLLCFFSPVQRSMLRNVWPPVVLTMLSMPVCSLVTSQCLKRPLYLHLQQHVVPL